MRLITALRYYKADQPEVREIKQQISLLEARKKRLPPTVRSGQTFQQNSHRKALESQLDTLRVQERGLLAQVGRLRGQHENAQMQLVAFPAWETTYQQLQRDRDRMQESQRDFHKELRHLRLREQAVGPPARLHSEAGLPNSPIRPRMKLNLLVAAALGLIFGVGMACLREMMDDRLYTSQQAEQLLGLPILGRVPIFPRRAPALIPVYRESTVKDSFRRLRAGLAIAGSAEPIQSLMVTSATSGEGKSTTAANLAVAAALQGQRVILVDTDLRNPSLSPFFGVRTEPGVSNVLLDGCPISDALHITDVPGLLLLPAGPPVQNAAELLAGPRMATLVQNLQELADLVILDTPPCLPVADAEVLGTRVDASLLVVGLGRTQKDAVRMAQELLDQSQVRLMGAVLNRMKANDRGYYYRYGVREAAPEGSLPAPMTALVRHPSSSTRSNGSGWEENET
jgi:capsular exopolysaccharide synthesis family protein